jgi:type 2 lantibiotic biosynthesis protein LanM
LTFLDVGPRGGIFDSGGLCGYGGQLEAVDRRGWIHTNTDAMRTVRGAAYAAPQKNLLLCDGNLQRTDRYSNDVIDGFAETFRFLSEHRSELASPDGPLRWLEDCATRFVFRPSNLYATVVNHLQTPKYQRTGWSQGLLIESMNRVFRGSRQRPQQWPLVAAERRSLEGLDIPHFTVPTDTTDLDPGVGELIVGLFERSGIEAVHDRLDALDERELEHQIGVLERVLWSSDTAEETANGGARAREPGLAGATDRPDIPSPERDPVVCAAEWIADQLNQSAAVRDDGSSGWSEIDPDAPLARWFLYDGDLGVALFFGALARITGAKRYRDAALSVTAGIGTLLEGEAASYADGDIAIGACNGIGGLIYPLACLGRLLDEGTLIEWALRLADAITSERVVADQRYDVEGGAAGAILALLALHRTTGEGWLIERAAECGDHLVTQGRPAHGGEVGWPNQDGLMLAGFAHGAAGIAHALARLHESTDRDAFLETAYAALRYERSLFDAAEGNWPVLVPPDVGGDNGRIFMSTWCHGAPGIALARLGVLKTLEDEEIKREIDAALEATLRVGVGQVDHLCCGNMGRVETLLTAGQFFKNVGHMRAAGIRSVMILQRAYDRGFFGLYPPGTAGPPMVPGFFRGLAGIGYQLLRQSHPDRLPSVALFQLDTEPSLRGNNE